MARRRVLNRSGDLSREVAYALVRAASRLFSTPFRAHGTLTLAEEAKLVAQAHARGTTPEALVREAIEPILSAVTENAARKETRPIWDVLVENMKDVPL